MNIKERMNVLENTEIVRLETEQNIKQRQKIEYEQKTIDRKQKEFGELHLIFGNLDPNNFLKNVRDEILGRGTINTYVSGRVGYTSGPNPTYFEENTRPGLITKLDASWGKYTPSYIETDSYDHSEYTPSEVGIRCYSVSINLVHCTDYINTEIKFEMDEKIKDLVEYGWGYFPKNSAMDLKRVNVSNVSSMKSEIYNLMEEYLAKLFIEHKKFNILPLSRLVEKDREIIFKAIAEGKLVISELPEDWILTNKEKEICQTRININRERQIQRQNEAKDNRNWFEKLVG